MALADETADIGEVSQAIGLKPSRLKRKWRQLHESSGFPPPLPGGGWVWDRRAVSRWIAAPKPVEAIHPGANDNETASNSLGGIIAAQANYLRARYQGQAE